MKTVTEKRFGEFHEDDISVTLRASSASYGGGQRGACYLPYSRTCGAICARDYKGVGAQYVAENKLVVKRMEQQMSDQYIVRRLTPTECERLQGFPDGWTDIGEWTDSKGRKHRPADAPRYKALGNSIALPFWFWLMRRISAQYERPATLGSLFDGIGGFPLVWMRCNGTNSVLWSSEIEEFPIAVLKKHFGDENTEGDIRQYL